MVIQLHSWQSPLQQPITTPVQTAPRFTEISNKDTNVFVACEHKFRENQAIPPPPQRKNII